MPVPQVHPGEWRSWRSILQVTWRRDAYSAMSLTQLVWTLGRCNRHVKAEMGKLMRCVSLEAKIRSSVLKMTSEGVEMPIEHMSLNFRNGNPARNRNLSDIST